VLFELRLLQGRSEELIEPFAQTAAENPSIDLLRVALGAAYCFVGRIDEAKPLFSRDAATGFAEIPRDNTWTTAMTFSQESAVALEHRNAAAILYDLLTPYGNMVLFNGGGCDGAVARSLGRLAHLLDQPDAAESHFRTALAINERLKAPYWIARTQLDFADLLRDVGRADEAAQLVDQALETAKVFGFAALESRATGFSA